MAIEYIAHDLVLYLFLRTLRESYIIAAYKSLSYLRIFEDHGTKDE